MRGVLYEKAAGLVMARIGSNMTPPVTVAEDADRVAALLERCPLGGLVLFNGRLPETPDVLGRLQAASPHPLLVAADVERGVGQQVWGATVFPHARAYAALGDEAEAAVEASARIMAREALACGIHLTFGPVADVNRDRRNPIIATRAFGETPDAVVPLVQAYIRGCHAEGLLTAAKHFPGHGATHQDSHEALPVVPDPRDVLEATDLVPFRAAIAAGTDLIMTAHVAYPALDARGGAATASRPILDDLLRGELGFRGAVVTDSLLMGAVRAAPDAVGRQAAALVAAGVDLLLDMPDPEAAVAGLVAAVEAGTLAVERLDEAVARVRSLGLRSGGTATALDDVGRPAHRMQAASVARRAVTVDAPAAELPLSPETVAEGGLLAVLVRPHRTRFDPPEAPLADALRQVYPGVRYREVGPESGALGAVLDAAADVQHVLIALIVKPAAWQPFGLLPDQHRLVEALTERRPVILASLGSPYVFDAYPQAVARVCTFSDVPDAQAALVAALVGS